MPDISRWGELLALVLPRAKTPLQITGLALLIVGGLAMGFAPPGNSSALLTAGGVGVGFLVFGQLFSYLHRFPERDRPMVFLISFGIFCLFTITMAFIAIRSINAPTMSLSPHTPSNSDRDEARASTQKYLRHGGVLLRAFNVIIPGAAAAPGDKDPLELVDVPLASTRGSSSEIRDSRDAVYRYSEVDGISTLSATLGYAEQSRAGLYPEADFHRGVTWGSPWISVNVANPGSAPLYLTQLKVDATDVIPINDVIISTGDVSGDKPPRVLRIENLGWGKAKNPHLKIAFALRSGDTRAKRITKWYDFALRDFDDQSEVGLDQVLPSRRDWKHANKDCDVILILGRLSYTDEHGDANMRSFRTGMAAGNCGAGGNIPPYAIFNVELPSDRASFPIYPPISDCIAPNSASKFVLRFTAPRSGRYKLDIRAKSTSGTVLSSQLNVDVLVPRDRSEMTFSRESSFLESGCS